MDVLEGERFLVDSGRLTRPFPLPGRGVGEISVVSFRLTLGCLALDAEVAAARLFSVKRIDTDESRRFRENRKRGSPFRATGLTPRRHRPDEGCARTPRVAPG